jgi:hypothetical protein
MHINVLNDNQRALLPLLATFKREYYLVGGTAIALHIGHRLSIDFDLFKNGTVHPKKILTKFNEKKEVASVVLNRDGQLNLLCRNVTFTFFDFEYEIPHPVSVEKSITIPTLLDLAAMKAFALGRRSKWKDYVDLFFILKDHYNLGQISSQATLRFGDLFSEKLFRGQLNYFQGISFEEQVDYMPNFNVSEEEVKQFLTEAALTGF